MPVQQQYGFGFIYAKAAVELATNRRPVPQLSEAFGTSGQIIRAIPDATTGPGAGATSTITLEYSVDFSEDVTVTSNCNHPSFRDLEVELTAPSGKVSKLAPHYDNSDGSTIPVASIAG